MSISTPSALRLEHQALHDLAKGQVEPYMASAISHAGWLKNNLADMLAEHRAIVGALELLVAAARAENRFDYAELAEKLMVHARREEEILYPAAILVGEYLKLKLVAAASA